MLKNLLLLLTIFTCTSLSAQVWDGGGDGTSWDDAMNWSTNITPAVGATVTFPDNATVNLTGTAPNAIRRIILDTLAIITLDLDLDFEVTGNDVHGITLQANSKLTLGGTTDMRTFNLSPGIGRNALNLTGVNSTLTISEQATLNINTCLNALRSNKDDAALVNNGTLTIVNYVEHGINIQKGNVTNNGTIDIGTGIVDGDPTSDGINISNGSVFDNNAGGNITVTKALDDGVDVLGIFNNAGTLSTVSNDDATANHTGLVVGSNNIEGIMNNLVGGTINTDGGVGEASRTLTIQTSGILNNAGSINVSRGNLGQALTNRGTLMNEKCAEINLVEGRISNDNAGMLTNNGLITSTYTAAGVSHNAADGSAINNAFYVYANANSDFAGGTETSTDNGQNSSAAIVVDAANTCMVADIGIDVSYTWYTDSAATIEAGTNDANGALTLNDDIFAEDGTQILYTSCFGEAVQLNIDNISGSCSLVSSLHFVQLSDVFTLMPNPAQTYTQLKFGNEYIAKEKTIEVYNAVGQLVKSANLNNADHYILNTNNFATGVYSVNLKTEKGMQIERLVIQK